MKPLARSAPRRFSQKEYLQALEDIGWMAAIPKAARTTLAARVAKIYGGGSVTALELCDALAVTRFDAETIDDDDSYATVLEQLAEASDGQFAPTKLEEKVVPQDERVHVGFSLGKQKFAVDVPVRNDWFDMDVIDILVNEALRDTGVASRFRALPTTDQCVALAFVPNEVWRKALEVGIVPAVRVVPFRDRKPCSEQELAARLPPGEGVAGLHEWTSQLREAILAEVREQGTARIQIGLGKFAVRPGRGPGDIKLTFMANQAFKNIANGEPVDDFDTDDDVVAAVAALLREDYDELPLPGIGRLRVRAMPAFDSHFQGEDVQFSPKNQLDFDFAPSLRAAIRKALPHHDNLSS